MTIEDLAALGIIGAIVGFGIETYSKHLEREVKEMERERLRLREERVQQEQNFHERCMAPFKQFEALDKTRAAASKNEGGAA
jgi:hypothetical protein